MIHALRRPAGNDHDAALRRVAFVVLVAFVLFMVLGWAHAVGALGHAHGHDHGAGHDDGGVPGQAESCRICDAVVLTAGAALFVAVLTFLAAVRATTEARRAFARVRVFEPRTVAAPRGPPAI